MDRRPVWLRRERGYRAYVRGLRFSLCGFALAGLTGLASAAGVLPSPVVVGLIVGSFVICVPSVLLGFIGWVLVPDKKRATRHDGALLSLVARDIFRGLPGD